MAGIEDLGNNLGYIYVVKPDKTSIVSAISNTPEGARDVKVDGVKAQAVALNRVATGTITLGTPSGVGTITSIVISGKNQIDTGSPISYTGATTAEDLAVLVRDAINNYDNITTVYTATANGSIVTVIADESLSGTVNGDTSVLSSTGFLTYTSTAISGGSSSTELYDEAIGYTFFINADYDSSGCSCDTSLATPDSLVNSVEITSYIVPRSLTSSLDSQYSAISSGGISFERKSSISSTTVDTESLAATDDLDTISVTGFAESDRMVITGSSSGRVVTIKDGVGNIELQGGNDFDTAEKDTAIELQLVNGTWYEIGRSTQSIGSTTEYRAAGYGIFGVETTGTQAVITSGSVTFDPSSAGKIQTITGSETLVGGLTYGSTGTPINGDEFFIHYDATTIIAGFSIAIFGITLTSEQALNGGLVVYTRYVSGAWKSYLVPNMDSAKTNQFKASTEFYKDASVTVPKVEVSLATETITRRVSFENGEECDNHIKMGYPGSVVAIYFTVDKVLSGTDNGTITPKNNAGTAMTDGLITATMSSALDSGFTTAGTISGNNTFVKNDILNFTTAKTTKGGFGTLSIEVLKS
tara:strand:- start:304 stop:2058 length:1755 start_codon:yes stop_codon:yes gene_type:complete